MLRVRGTLSQLVEGIKTILSEAPVHDKTLRPYASAVFDRTPTPTPQSIRQDSCQEGSGRRLALGCLTLLCDEYSH